MEALLGFAASNSMGAVIKSKCNHVEMLELLMEVESDPLRIDVFTRSLLFLGPWQVCLGGIGHSVVL